MKLLAGFLPLVTVAYDESLWVKELIKKTVTDKFNVCKDIDYFDMNSGALANKYNIFIRRV